MKCTTGQQNNVDNGGASLVGMRKEVRFVDQLREVGEEERSENEDGGGVVDGGRIGDGEENINGVEIINGEIKMGGKVNGEMIEERIELVRIPASQMTTERLVKNKLKFKSLGVKTKKYEVGSSRVVDGGKLEGVIHPDLEVLLQEFDESIKNSPHNKKRVINSEVRMTDRVMNFEVNERMKFKESSSCVHCGGDGGRVVELMKELKALEGRMEAVQQKNQLLTSQNEQLSEQLKSK